MRIYIQAGLGEFVDDWAYAAYEGASKLGIETIKFEDIMEVPANGSMVVAHIDLTQKYLERCGCRVPKAMNMPKEILESGMLSRNIGVRSLEDFVNDTANNLGPIFVKSWDGVKTIPSGVIKTNSREERRILFNDCNMDELLLTSSVIEIESEYRVFVQNREIVGVKHYQGDAFRSISRAYVEDCLRVMNDSRKSPASYTLDFAALKYGGTEFIEANDGWSVGNYGLDGKVYLRFLMARWKELISDKI